MTNEDQTIAERLRGDLAHYNAQAEEIGAALEPSAVWRFGTQMFHRMIDAFAELEGEVNAEGALSDDEISAILGSLAAGALLAQAMDEETKLKKGTREAAARFNAAMTDLAGVFRDLLELTEPEPDDDEEPQEIETATAPANGATPGSKTYRNRRSEKPRRDGRGRDNRAACRTGTPRPATLAGCASS